MHFAEYFQDKKIQGLTGGAHTIINIVKWGYFDEKSYNITICFEFNVICKRLYKASKNCKNLISKDAKPLSADDRYA